MRHLTLEFDRKPDDLFVYVPAALSTDYLEEALSRNLGKPIRIRDCTTTNLCADGFGGTACSGATMLGLRLRLLNGGLVHAVVKILSPDPVNLYKIDCRYDARIAEIRWTKWWGKRRKEWAPLVYDTHLALDRREFWILREFFPQVGWPDIAVSNSGHFRLDEERLRAMVETVAELHAESSNSIAELRQLFPEPGIGQGRECRLADLEGALDAVIADNALFRAIGIGEAERDQIKGYREILAKRPAWLEEWKIVCVTADLKPNNLGFREGSTAAPVLFDFGAARLAPMEEELALLLDRLRADETLMTRLLAWYLDRFAEHAGERIAAEDFRRRLPWAEPLLLLRSLVEHADALRWVPGQDRSKGFIRYFIKTVGKQLDRCAPCHR